MPSHLRDKLTGVVKAALRVSAYAATYSILALTCLNPRLHGQYSKGEVLVGNGTMTPVSSAILLDATQFPGADFCLQVRAAYSALPADGGTIDARGFSNPQYCSVNPFFKTGTSNNMRPFVLLLGEYDIFTSVPWVTPQIAHKIVGVTTASTDGSGFAPLTRRQGSWLIACNHNGPLNTVGTAPSQCDSTSGGTYDFPLPGTGYQLNFGWPHGPFHGPPQVIFTQGSCNSFPIAALNSSNVSGGSLTGSATVVGNGGGGCLGTPPTCSIDADQIGSGGSCTVTINPLVNGGIVSGVTVMGGLGYFNGVYQALINLGGGGGAGQCADTPVTLGAGVCDGTRATGGWPNDLFGTEVGDLSLSLNGVANTFGIYTANCQENCWMHDLEVAQYAASTSTTDINSNAGIFCDTTDNPMSQCTHNSIVNFAASSDFSIPNSTVGNGWGLAVQGATAYIYIPKNGCQTRPRAYVGSYISGPPTSPVITYNGGSTCATHTSPPLQCLVLSGAGSGTTCTASFSGGVLQSITLAGGSGYRNKVTSFAPFRVEKITCRGLNPDGMTGCVGMEGVNDANIQSIHSEYLNQPHFPTPLITANMGFSPQPGTITQGQEGAAVRLGFGNAPVISGHVVAVDGADGQPWAIAYLGAGVDGTQFVAGVGPSPGSTGLNTIVDDQNCAAGSSSAQAPCPAGQNTISGGSVLQVYRINGIVGADAPLNSSAGNAGLGANFVLGNGTAGGSTSGNGAPGGAWSLTSGTGGAATSGNGGNGGTVTITTGAGGAGGGGGGNGNGGNIVLSPGAAGGTGAVAGLVQVNAALNSGNVSAPKFSASTGAPAGGSLPFRESCGSTTSCAHTYPAAQAQIAHGTVALAAGAATVSGVAGFNGSFNCTCSDNSTATNSCYAKAGSGLTSINLAGTGSDVVSYICVGD